MVYMNYVVTVNIFLLTVFAVIFAFFSIFFVIIAAFDEEMVKDIMKDSEIKNPWLVSIIYLGLYLLFSSLAALLFMVAVS